MQMQSNIKDLIENGEAWLPDLSPEMYYGCDRLGSSRLKAFTTSPLHYHKFADMEDTPALIFGRAAHVYNLEGEKVFHEQYCVIPEGYKRNSVKYKAWLADQGDRIPISTNDYNKILGMHDTLMSSYAAPYIEQDGFIESSLLWTHCARPFDSDDIFHIKAKGRIDKLILQPDESWDILFDYKTCMSVHPYDIQRQIAKFKYWLQEGWYRDGHLKTRKKNAKMLFLFQEKSPPYDVALVMLSDEARLRASNTCFEITGQIAECYINDEWPGQNFVIQEWNFRDE